MMNKVSSLGLNKLVDVIFNKYDRDRSGYLDVQELGGFLTEVFSMAKIPITVSQTQAYMFMKLIDKNKDGRVDRSELYSLVGMAYQGGGMNGGMNNGNYGNNGYNNSSNFNNQNNGGYNNFNNGQNGYNNMNGGYGGNNYGQGQAQTGGWYGGQGNNGGNWSNGGNGYGNGANWNNGY